MGDRRRGWTNTVEPTLTRPLQVHGNRRASLDELAESFGPSGPLNLEAFRVDHDESIMTLAFSAGSVGRLRWSKHDHATWGESRIVFGTGTG